MTDAPAIYMKARADVAAMLGYDVDALTPEQATRLDVATALRVLLDNQSARLVRGESLDARELLMASEALSRLLPPLREPPPPSNREDPRAYMWRTYLESRRRGELADPTSTFEGRGRRIAELEAKIAALEVQLAEAPFEPTLVATVPPDNVVPLSRPSLPPPPPPPPAAAAPAPRDWGSTDGGRKWRDWYDAGGSYAVPGSIGDHWSDHRD
jgi:hypothetical protein